MAPGHGLGNVTPYVYDPGAEWGIHQEAEIVSEIACEVDARIFPVESSEYGITLTPACSDACAKRHPTSSHLGYTIRYYNENGAKFDLLLSLHMNAGPPSATGVEVFYSAGASDLRKEQARVVSETLSRVLGIKDRGPKPDTDSAVGRLGILRGTKFPALLIEFGFITNPTDVHAVTNCGVDALIAAMEAARKVTQQWEAARKVK